MVIKYKKLILFFVTIILIFNYGIFLNVIHESGHFITALLLGYNPEINSVGFLKGSISVSHLNSNTANILISSMGIVSEFILGTFMFIFSWKLKTKNNYLCKLSLFFGLFTYYCVLLEFNVSYYGSDLYRILGGLK